ncbi:MAG: hypothetical protein DMG58_37570 [Acidobacteria bacterium]|nr:MAG: hypothetical protein DMG58_37570 [Acidobacteriota bacterium]
MSGRQLCDVSALLPSPRAVRAEDDFHHRVSVRFRLWRGHQVPERAPHLGRPQYGRHLRDLGHLYDWKASENKFKCPCHGSGYDPEGVNFEGPAPRPMDRAHVELDPSGEIVVDLSRLYRWPKGERSQFGDPGAILRV